MKRTNARVKATYKNGGLAQLGERLLCKQEVNGSIPLISTIGKSKGELKNRVKGENLKTGDEEE